MNYHKLRTVHLSEMYSNAAFQRFTPKCPLWPMTGPRPLLPLDYRV